MSWYEDAALMIRVRAGQRYMRRSNRLYVRAQRLLDKSDRVYAKGWEAAYGVPLTVVDVEVVD